MGNNYDFFCINSLVIGWKFFYSFDLFPFLAQSMTIRSSCERRQLVRVHFMIE